MKNTILLFSFLLFLSTNFAQAQSKSKYTEIRDVYYSEIETYNHYNVTSKFDSYGKSVARTYTLQFGAVAVVYTEFAAYPRNAIMSDILNIDLVKLNNIRFRCVPGGALKFSNRPTPNVTESPCLPDGYNFNIK